MRNHNIFKLTILLITVFAILSRNIPKINLKQNDKLVKCKTTKTMQLTITLLSLKIL